jgi:hypothetical protein
MFYQQAFLRAKIKITSIAILSCLFIYVGIVGCRKENGNESIGTLLRSTIDRGGDESNPIVTNGMLYFESFEKFNAFIKSLKDNESDSSQVKQAYISLGINVDAESIPNLTDNPICLKMDQAIGAGFTSSRKAQETVINAALNQGDDNINSIIISPYLKTALNSDNAVHIGRRIYKYYDNGGIAIVLNDDWVTYDGIKTQAFESLKQSYNLIVTSEASDDREKYFTLNMDGSINTSKNIYKPLFNLSVAADGKFNINNISWVESTLGAATFKWIYPDNTSSIGLNPSRTIGSGETFTVIIDNGTGIKDTLTVSESILICSVENFTITSLANNQIRFELPGFIPTNPNNIYTIKWIFSDGTTSLSNPALKTFSSNGTATCQWYWKNSGILACQFTKPFFIKCGDKKEKFQSFIINNAGGSGQKWKLDCEIWVKSGEVGCKVKYLRRFGVVWLAADNEGSHVDISGTYKKEVNTPNKTCLDITASGSKTLGAGTYPTSVSFTILEVPNVFREPNLLSSANRIKVNGVWIGPGSSSMPRLILD